MFQEGFSRPLPKAADTRLEPVFKQARPAKNLVTVLVGADPVEIVFAEAVVLVLVLEEGHVIVAVFAGRILIDGEVDAEVVGRRSLARAIAFVLGGFDDVVSGRAWFFAVARNIVLKQMRRDRIVRIDAVAEIDALGIVDYEPSAERAVSGRQELARVQRLIEALPERCRLIFTMRKIDGLPQKEIAARLRVSENIVEKEAAKGLRLVLQGLGEEAGARRPFRLFARKARDARKADRR